MADAKTEAGKRTLWSPTGLLLEEALPTSAIMSDKPRVYQGVRVRTTVKELLQRLRAREDISRKAKTVYLNVLLGSAAKQRLALSRYVAPPPVVPPADASSCGARTFQLDGSCNTQMLGSSFNDIQQQFGDMMLPSNGYAGNNNNNNNTGSGYSACLPPHPAFPPPCRHGLSSDADYYGHGMAPCSSPEPLKLCNPTDHSYSPQDSFSSSSSSSCYDSPTRMESGYRGLPSEHFQYQHCSLQDCACSPRCWPVQQESFSAPDYAPYYPPTDYPYAGPVEEDCVRRDSQMSSQMCYNVL
ncbi:colorectal cancer associated 2 [Lycodopsis pacificus]